MCEGMGVWREGGSECGEREKRVSVGGKMFIPW